MSGVRLFALFTARKAASWKSPDHQSLCTLDALCQENKYSYLACPRIPWTVQIIAEPGEMS